MVFVFVEERHRAAVVSVEEEGKAVLAKLAGVELWNLPYLS